MIKRYVFCLIAILPLVTNGFSQSKPSTPSKKMTDDKIVLNGVRVNNFFKKNIGSYGNVILLISGTNPVQYDKNRNTFQIAVEAITPSDFRKNQKVVESQLLKLLGITRKDACRLKVEETANSPGGWDGKKYGLSFCAR